MPKKLILILITLTILSLACNFSIDPGQFLKTGTSPAAVSQLLVTADPNASPTATPFQPALPTLTSSPEDLATPTSEPDNGYIPPDNSSQNAPPNQVHILVLGSDWRPSGGFRTDTIVLLAINTDNNTVRAVSFPRDLYVEIPGYGVNRINTAHPKGFDVMANTFEYNFGIRPDFYIMTNFQGFIQTIDSLGGIDVNASQNLTDRCKLPQASGGYCSFGPGVIHMNGETALWYVRSRYSTSDFDRLRRSQEVLTGVFWRMMSLDVVNRLPELFEIYRQNVETNLTLEIIAPLVDVAPHLGEPGTIKGYTITPSDTIPYRVPESGAQVLLPIQENINAIIQQAFFTTGN
jgi:polyisoprenyl-teichoic acid--peptidoglycan teichoic acid transferase